jgi:hypothetical protein
LEISIREQSSAASNDGPTALPSGLWKSVERNFGGEDASLLGSVGVVLLHNEGFEDNKTAAWSIEGCY